RSTTRSCSSSLHDALPISFATPFTSTFRGVLQGFPMKLVFIHLKKGPYYVMVRPDIKDVQQLKGKRIGVATIKGTDQLVAEEMLDRKSTRLNSSHVSISYA